MPDAPSPEDIQTRIEIIESAMHRMLSVVSVVTVAFVMSIPSSFLLAAILLALFVPDNVVGAFGEGIAGPEDVTRRAWEFSLPVIAGPLAFTVVFLAGHLSRLAAFRRGLLVLALELLFLPLATLIFSGRLIAGFLGTLSEGVQDRSVVVQWGESLGLTGLSSVGGASITLVGVASILALSCGIPCAILYFATKPD